jgi:hypothetical protein
MGNQRPRQQTAGARSRGENNKQETRCPSGRLRTPKAVVTKATAYASRKVMAGKSTSASATFNLARSLKCFILTGRQFDENFCLLPLYGNGKPLSKPQDVPNSKDAITVYYRHRLAGNNVTKKMKIQSTSTIAQMKHATSNFKEKIGCILTMHSWGQRRKWYSAGYRVPIQHSLSETICVRQLRIRCPLNMPM